MLNLHPPMLGLLFNFFDSPMDLAVIAIIALLLFGKRLPDLAKSMGKSIVEFKKGLSQTTEEIKKATETQPDEEPAQINATKTPPGVGPGTPVGNPRQIKQVTSVSEEP